MDRELAVDHIERDANHIIDLATKADHGTEKERADRRIPSCPDWTLPDLANHLGRVYAMVATALEGDPDEALERSSIPHRPDDQAPADWLRQRLEILLGLLRARSEDDRAWNFAEGAGAPVGFWWRRQAHETLIHRVDAQLSVGESVTPPDSDLAADGVGDFLLISGYKEVGWADLQLGDGMSLHLHATDAPEAEWTIDTTSHTYGMAHLKADVAVRGPAWDLDLWLWRRGYASLAGAEEGVPALELETFGDLAAAEAWRPKL